MNERHLLNALKDEVNVRKFAEHCGSQDMIIVFPL
jgi:hypothetical protein